VASCGRTPSTRSRARTPATNLGIETPVIHFEQWEQDEIEVKLILKGGGCENKNIQYSLPCELEHMGRADRTLEGVRKCILHAVWQAQGQGLRAGRSGRVHRERSRRMDMCSRNRNCFEPWMTRIRFRSWRRWKRRSWRQAKHNRHRRDGIRRQDFR